MGFFNRTSKKCAKCGKANLDFHCSICKRSFCEECCEKAANSVLDKVITPNAPLFLKFMNPWEYTVFVATMRDKFCNKESSICPVCSERHLNFMISSSKDANSIMEEMNKLKITCTKSPG